MIELTLDTLNTVELPKNGITDAGYQELYEKLIAIQRTDLAKELYTLWKIPHWRQWMVSEKGEYVGTWPKRFAKWCYQEKGAKLNHEIMSAMGDILARHCERGSKKFTYEISKFIDWTPGDFGEPGNQSCWWTSHDSDRRGLGQHPDGFSVLFYQNEDTPYRKEKGTGRCWLFKVEKGIVIFNAYGEQSLNKIAQILATKMGMSYRKIILHGHPKHEVYLNQGNKNNENGGDPEEGGANHAGGKWGMGFLIGDEQDIRGISDVQLPDFRYRDGKCCICDAMLVKKDSVHTGKGYYCSDCQAKLVKCQICGEWEDADTIKEVYHDGSKVKVCYRHPVHTCEEHGATIDQCYNAWHTNKWYCQECMNDGKIVTCQGCQRVVNNYVTIKLPMTKICLCQSCITRVKEA